MALTWILSEIRAKVRVLTGQPEPEQMTDTEIDDKINDFYRNIFPTVVDVDELRGHITQLLTATDSGKYTLSDVHHLQPNPKLDGADILFYLDEDEFFDLFPQDTGSAFVISDAGAGLEIGSSSSSAVKNANTFYYDIAGKSYTKDSAETELAGSVIPQNKYGAWRLEIDTSGIISVIQATLNAGDKVIGTDLLEYIAIVSHTAAANTRPVTGGDYTTVWSATGKSGTTETWVSGTAYSATGLGYDTPGQAVQGLPAESSEFAAMGYVTAINTGATFVPGTTSLSDGTVTATYTDGWNSSRNDPLAMLWYAQSLYVRPKSDDWHELKIPYIKKPTALTAAVPPTDVRWGPILAYGTAIEILTEEGNAQGGVSADSLRPELVRLVNIVSGRTTQQKQDRRVKARY